jgi:hypothetical protein
VAITIMVMRTSTRRVITVAAALLVLGGRAGPPAPAAVLENNFQGGRFDNDALLLVGKDSEQLVKPTPRGLLVRIPPKRGSHGPVGIELQPRIRGDFEIDASYQLVEFATPPAGTGIRVKLTAELANRTRDRVTIERAAIPKEGNVCTSTVTEGPSGKGRHSSFVRRSVLARAGRLRIARTGFLMRLDYTDDLGKLRTLREINLGNDDPSRVTLVLDTGRSAQGAAVLIKELKLSAQVLRPPTDEPVGTGRWGIKTVLVANAALIAGLAVGVSVLVRPRRTGTTPTPTPAARPRAPESGRPRADLPATGGTAP